MAQTRRRRRQTSHAKTSVAKTRVAQRTRVAQSKSPSQRARPLLLAHPPANPALLFARWYAEAQAKEISDPNAMTLATAEPRGGVSARIVLLKDAEGDLYTFYTNSESRKGQALAQEARVALLFHWKSLRRQVRIEGRARLVSAATADAYFATRPRGAQIGAWASQQSRPQTKGRRGLEQRTLQMEKRFAGLEVPRPPHWTGYVVRATRLEFWNEGQYRLHERVEYRKGRGQWRWQRLDP